jgi:hypothetical protein
MQENETAAGLVTPMAGGASGGFHTAGNRPLAVSAASVQRAQSLIAASHADYDIQENEKAAGLVTPMAGGGFGGLQTAGGKPISMSTASMHKARAVMEADDADYDVQRQQEGSGLVTPMAGGASRGFHTAGNRPLAVSAASVQKAQALIAASHADYDMQENEKAAGLVTPMAGRGFGGLQTAGGKPISMSTASMHTARAVMEADDADYDVQRQQEGSGLVTPMAGGGFGGLQTAGGKALTMSTASMHKARALMGADDADYDVQRQQEGSGLVTPMAGGGFGGLQTAGGKALTTSTASMQRARAVMEADDADPTSEKPQHESQQGEPQTLDPFTPGVEGVECGGLLTARGRPVSVSTAHAQKARALLRGADASPHYRSIDHSAERARVDQQQDDSDAFAQSNTTNASSVLRGKQPLAQTPLRGTCSLNGA